MGRWSLDDFVALLWAAAGIGLAVYFGLMALETRDMGVSPLPQAGLAVVALIGFSVVAWRHARAAGRARAERESGPGDGRGSSRRRPGPGDTVGDGARPGTPTPARPGTPPAPRPAPPELSPSGRAELARVVGVLDRAGLFQPRAPAPVHLMPAVADAGEPVTVDTVLGAVLESDHYDPAFRPDDHLRAVALHDSHVEQFSETLREHVADLDRLAGNALTVVLDEVDVADDGQTRMLLRTNDDVRELRYAGHLKYLSSVLHVAVAQALHAAHPDGPRLAWTWCDQGVWLAALRPPLTVAALNAELGRAAREPWTWVDEERPVAAGDPRR